MPVTSVFRLETERSEACMQLLCASLSDFATVSVGARGQVRFPFGWCRIEADRRAVTIEAGSDDAGGLRRVEALVARRLGRFSRRAARSLVWRPCDGRPTDLADG